MSASHVRHERVNRWQTNQRTICIGLAFWPWASKSRWFHFPWCPEYSWIAPSFLSVHLWRNVKKTPFWGALFAQLRFALLVWFAALIPSGYIFLFSAVTPAARELVWTWPLAQLVDILLGSPMVWESEWNRQKAPRMAVTQGWRKAGFWEL